MPEQLGEETLEEDEVDEDLKPQEPREQGPGFRERSGGNTTGYEGRKAAQGTPVTRRLPYKTAHLAAHRNPKSKHHTLNPACRYA